MSRRTVRVRQTVRQTDSESQTDGQAGGQTDRERQTDSERQTDGQAGGRRTVRVRRTVRGRRTVRQVGGPTDRRRGQASSADRETWDWSRSCSCSWSGLGSCSRPAAAAGWGQQLMCWWTRGGATMRGADQWSGTDVKQWPPAPPQLAPPLCPAAPPAEIALPVGAGGRIAASSSDPYAEIARGSLPSL